MGEFSKFALMALRAAYAHKDEILDALGDLVETTIDTIGDMLG